MSITKIVRKVFEPRQKELEKHFNQGKALQETVLSRLVAEAKDTEYGRNHVFSSIKDYDDFIKNTPINTYEELKGDIEASSAFIGASQEIMNNPLYLDQRIFIR